MLLNSSMFFFTEKLYKKIIWKRIKTPFCQHAPFNQHFSFSINIIVHRSSFYSFLVQFRCTSLFVVSSFFYVVWPTTERDSVSVCVSQLVYFISPYYSAAKCWRPDNVRVCVCVVWEVSYYSSIENFNNFSLFCTYFYQKKTLLYISTLL